MSATRITIMVSEEELQNVRYRAVAARTSVSTLLRPLIEEQLRPFELSTAKKEEAAQ